MNGAVGEVGWPAGADVARWSDLADQWDAVARAAKLPVLMWATSEWLPPSYTLRAAAPATSSAGSLAVLGPQLELLLNGRGKSQTIGVNDVGGEFGTPASFSSTNPGVYGTAWHFDNLDSLKFLSGEGIKLVRAPIRWERLQPILGGPLDQAAVKQLERYLLDAGTAGVSVILDVHNFGEYDEGVPGSSVPKILRLGTNELPDAMFAEFWMKLVDAFGKYAAISGWDLMNEPRGLPSTGGSAAETWEVASQEAVDAIRETGDHHTVWIEGYNYSATGSFAKLTPAAWIKDPAHAVIYEAHTYFDQDGSGQYAGSYSPQEAKAEAADTRAGATRSKVCMSGS